MKIIFAFLLVVFLAFSGYHLSFRKFRIPLFARRPDFPIYADNINQLKISWNKLIENGVKTIYPGHGKSFSVEIIKKQQTLVEFYIYYCFIMY